ncbi:MAG: class I SAM-dependent methyltransferase [Myxococcota bacterium]
MRHTFTLPESSNADEMMRRLEGLERSYHSFYFDDGRCLRGDYDIGLTISQFPFPKDLAGLRVLDVGIGAGWFSCYFAERGAEVTAFDARGACDRDFYGRWEYPALESEKSGPDRLDEEGRPVYHDPIDEPFFILRESLGHSIPFHSGRVYDLPRILEGQQFDLVFMGAILGHLRDPIGGVMAARAVCRGQLVATQVVNTQVDQGLPLMFMPYTSFSRRAWWVPNREGFRHWFLAAGFREVDVDHQVTLIPDVPQEHESGTGRPANPQQVHNVGVAQV